MGLWRWKGPLERGSSAGRGVPAGGSSAGTGSGRGSSRGCTPSTVSSFSQLLMCGLNRCSGTSQWLGSAAASMVDTVSVVL